MYFLFLFLISHKIFNHYDKPALAIGALSPRARTMSRPPQFTILIPDLFKGPITACSLLVIDRVLIQVMIYSGDFYGLEKVGFEP